MWSNSKSSSLSFRSAIRGGATSELPFKNLIMWLVSLLPVADMAYTYATWMKTPISSLPVFVSTLQRAYPHLHTALTDILKLRGEECRAATEDALDDLFGHFSGQVHSAFIYGVVIYIWVTTASSRQDELRQMLVRYLSTQQHKLGQFRAQCNTPTTATVSAAEFHRAAAIVLPVDVGKSRLRTRSLSEFPETSWLCSLDKTAPLSRSPVAGTNPDWAEKQHAPHSARRSAHQHAPIRKQEAQQGGFILLLFCP